jgi:hypothetical protein
MPRYTTPRSTVGEPATTAIGSRSTTVFHHCWSIFASMESR